MSINSDPERKKEYMRKWFQNLSEEEKQKRREYRLAWGKKNKEKLKEWRSTSEAHKAWKKARRDKETEELKDCYVKRVLKHSEIPPTNANMELKRLEIKLNRKIKEVNQQLKK